MNRRRLVLGGVGLVLVAAVVLAEGALAGLVVLDPLVAAAGNDFFFAVGLGLVVLLLAIATLGRSGSVDQTETPDVEESVSMPVPGDDLDETVDRWRLSLPLVGSATRERVRERLRAAAVETLTRSSSVGQAEAERLVATGEWTDDPVAAGFLARNGAVGGDRSGGREVTGPSPGWLASLGRLEPPLAIRTRRTVDAIAAVAAGGRAA